MDYALPLKIIVCTCYVKAVNFLGPHTSCAAEMLSKHFLLQRREAGKARPHPDNCQQGGNDKCALYDSNTQSHLTVLKKKLVHFLTAGTFLCHVKASKENSIEMPCCGWITCTCDLCELEGNYWRPQLCSGQVNLSEEKVIQCRNFSWDYNLTLLLRCTRICCYVYSWK